jgi:intracellular multiplication protein IcmK
MVNLAPGTAPPAIRLAQGYISSLVFVDSTGAPWPIAAFDNGDPKAFNIQWEAKSNILLIQAQKPYTYGNMAIRLKGLNTPIMLTLVPGQKVVDYRVDLHVSGIGPNTKHLPVGTGLPNSANELLLHVLDGVAPPGSALLKVSGSAHCEAWSLGAKLYVRTRFTLLSPGWVSHMTSADGMHAYELQKTPSLLVSQYGKPVEVKIHSGGA